MRNPLHEELLDLDYVPIEKLDEELPPEYVLLYVKNLSGVNQRFIIENIDTTLETLVNSNPSSEMIDENTIQFCLSPAPYSPVVSIDDISDIIDPVYPYRLTVTGTISVTAEETPNSLNVRYYDTIVPATFIGSTNRWTASFDLETVDKTTLQNLSATGTTFNIVTGKLSQESDQANANYSIIITPVYTLDPAINVVITVEDILRLIPAINVRTSVEEIITLLPAINVTAVVVDKQAYSNE